FSALARFFFHDPASTAIYTISLHDALPILEHDGVDPDVHEHLGAIGGSDRDRVLRLCDGADFAVARRTKLAARRIDRDAVSQHADRKSTRLNSSHVKISYAVFCLKKKEQK